MWTPSRRERSCKRGSSTTRPPWSIWTRCAISSPERSRIGDPMTVHTKETRGRYVHMTTLAMRWADNDIYGHVNNAVYYEYFDTVINRYLIDEGKLDIVQGAVIGLCVESHCGYDKPLAFPGSIEVGLRVGHLGR